MGFIGGLWLVILGALGAASLIIARKPGAKALLDKFAPYQGWIGAVSALWGVWIVISAILSIGWLTAAPVYWATYLATGAVQLTLGLLLGVGVLKTFIKDETAQTKMDQTIARLAPRQGALGMAAMGLGVWMVVAGFVWTMA